MAQTPICESILIADCGAAATKVALVDRVGGDFRLIGIARTPTTAEPPVSDISIGVRRAIGQLETLAGRQMLTGEGELIAPETQEGSGVDAFVAITSAAPPLRAVIVGLSRDQSVALAQRALAATSVIVEETIAVDEESGRWGTNAKDGVGGGPSVAVEQVLALQPDVIVMTGGTDGGARTQLVELANIVACIAQALDPTNRPVVVFAGNRDARAVVAERIGSTTEFRATDNIMPRLKTENFRPLQDEVQAVQFERKIKALPGLDKLVAWSARPLTSSLMASERVVEFLAKRHNLRVQALDAGAGMTAWLYADPSNTVRALSPDLGQALGLDTLISRARLDGIGRWLPPELDLEDAHACLLNQSLRPWTTPVRGEERTVLQAAAREAAGRTWSNVSPEIRQSADLVVLSGAPVVRGGKPSALMLLALDALDVRGVFSIAVDASGIVPAIGALATVNSEAAAQVLERDGLVTLGTAVVATLPAGRMQGAALRATIGTPKGKLEVEVAPGTMELIPLGLGEKASVEIKPARGVSLGVPLTKGVFKREVEGGTVGLLIDARGRPLPFAASPAEQREQTQKWRQEAGA